MKMTSVIICLVTIVLTIGTRADTTNEEWEQQMRAAMEAIKVGDSMTAINRTKEALTLADSWEEGDTRYLLTIDNLAWLYQLRQQYDDAEALFKQSLDIRSRVHGEQSEEVALVLDRLIELKRDREQFDEMIILYKRAIAIREGALGPEHPQVATTLNDLGSLYYSQGRFEEAESTLKQALAIREKALGKQDVQTLAASLNNLALLYQAQGRVSEAITLLERAIALLNEHGGSETAFAQFVTKNLIALYRTDGRDRQADELEALGQ